MSVNTKAMVWHHPEQADPSERGRYATGWYYQYLLVGDFAAAEPTGPFPERLHALNEIVADWVESHSYECDVAYEVSVEGVLEHAATCTNGPSSLEIVFPPPA